jgi:hypothetical protein
MKHILTTAACLLTLAGPAAFAQTTMTNTNPSMQAPAAGQPAQMAPKPMTPSTDPQKMDSNASMSSPTAVGKQDTTPPGGMSPNTASNPANAASTPNNNTP